MREDQAQYNMRLNLKDEKQLKIHRVMMDLNKDSFKSKNQFMIESVYKNIVGTSDEVLTNEGAERAASVRYVTMEEFEKLRAELRQDMMQMIVRAMSDNNNKSITDLTITLNKLLSSGAFVQASQQVDEEENTESEPIDSALLEVAGNYF